MSIDPGNEPIFAALAADPRFADIAGETINRAELKTFRGATGHAVGLASDVHPDECRACQPHRAQFVAENPPQPTGTRRRGSNVKPSRRTHIDLGDETNGVTIHQQTRKPRRKK